MKIVSTFLKKIKNTFLTPRWNSVYKRYDEKNLLQIIEIKYFT